MFPGILPVVIFEVLVEGVCSLKKNMPFLLPGTNSAFPTKSYFKINCRFEVLWIWGENAHENWIIVMNSQEKYFFLQPSFQAERNKHFLVVLSVVSDLSEVPRLLIGFPFRFLPSVGSRICLISYILQSSWKQEFKVIRG